MPHTHTRVRARGSPATPSRIAFMGNSLFNMCLILWQPRIGSSVLIFEDAFVHVLAWFEWLGPVRFSYNPSFLTKTVFFSHSKSAGTLFGRLRFPRRITVHALFAEAIFLSPRFPLSLTPPELEKLVFFSPVAPAIVSVLSFLSSLMHITKSFIPTSLLFVYY